jgi:hypothetical protein
MRTGSSRSNLAATTLKDRDQFRGKFSETQASADRQPAFVVPAEQRDVQAAIERLNARHVLIIADSCFAGAFRTRGDDRPDPKSMTRIQFLDQANLRSSRSFISSGASEPVVDQGGRGHSAFAQALLDGLIAESKPLTAGELFQRRILAQVGGTTKQLPQYFRMKGGDEGGEFVFIPGASSD